MSSWFTSKSKTPSNNESSKDQNDQNNDQSKQTKTNDPSKSSNKSKLGENKSNAVTGHLTLVDCSPSGTWNNFMRGQSTVYSTCRAEITGIGNNVIEARSVTTDTYVTGQLIAPDGTHCNRGTLLVSENGKPKNLVHCPYTIYTTRQDVKTVVSSPSQLHFQTPGYETDKIKGESDSKNLNTMTKSDWFGLFKTTIFV